MVCAASFCASAAVAQTASAGDTVYGLTATDKLVVFDAERPGTVAAGPALTGLIAGDDVESIDFRPATGQLYALITNTGTATVARIDTVSGAVTKLTAAPPAVAGTDFGFDFNPVADRIRVHAGTENLRFNPNTGGLAATDPVLVFEDAVGTPNVTATAYTSSFPGPSSTQLYGIDSTLDQVVTLQSVAPGFQNVTKRGPLGVDASALGELDVSPRGDALAVLEVAADSPKLFRVNLDIPAGGAAAARDIGTIGGGGVAGDPVEEIAVAPKVREFVALSDATPHQLLFFRGDRPGTQTRPPVAVTGLPTGVELVGIDTRSANGVLYAAGDDSILYSVDTDTGAATAVGTGFPTLVGASFGFDFNPAADRLRIVSDGEQNQRLNPDTGATAVNPPNGTDSALAPAGEVTAAAYTNPEAGTRNTTLFALDTGTNSLVRIGDVDGAPASPNGGAVNTIGSLGAPDYTANASYDIVPEFNLGYAALETGTALGTSDLFTIGAGNTASEAVKVGSIGSLVRGLAFLNEDLISVSSATVKVDENDGTVVIGLRRTGGSETAATVTVNTADGTAVAGQDYTAVTNQVVTFARGETTKTVSVSVTNNAVLEGSESFIVGLSAPTGGAGLAAPRQSTVTIRDDEVAPPVTVTVFVPVTTAPPLIAALGAGDEVTRRTLSRKGLRASVTCSLGCSYTATVTLDAGARKRLRIRSGSLATVRGTFANGGSKAFRLKPSRANRRKLAKATRGKLSVKVVVTETATKRTRTLRQAVAIRK